MMHTHLHTCRLSTNTHCMYSPLCCVSLSFIFCLLQSKGLEPENLTISHMQVNRAAKMRRRTYRAHGRINGTIAVACKPLPPSPPPTNTALTHTDFCLQPPCLLLLLLPPAYMCNPCHIELIVSEKNEDVARPADLPRRKATRKELAKRRVASGGGVEAEA